MTNWGNASKTCASIPQDTAEHNRRELVAFCQGCWHFTDFRHNKGKIAALELMTKLKIDAHRPASGTQGRLRGTISIFADTPEGMQTLLDVVQEFTTWCGMEINIKKSFLLVTDKDRKRRESTPNQI